MRRVGWCEALGTIRGEWEAVLWLKADDLDGSRMASLLHDFASFPEARMPVLSKPGEILEKEHHAQQRSGNEADREADKKHRDHGGRKVLWSIRCERSFLSVVS